MTTEVDGYIRQLVKYIKKNISKGYMPESLRWALINQGYPRTQVNKAIEIANQEIASAIPKFVEKPIIKVETTPPVEKKPGFWEKIRSFFS